MMDTVLNVGLTDDVIPGLVARGGERFAWDCYRRLVQMYGKTVLGVDGELFDKALSEARREAGVSPSGSRGSPCAPALLSSVAGYVCTIVLRPRTL